jgi:hypothetical protein
VIGITERAAESVKVLGDQVIKLTEIVQSMNKDQSGVTDIMKQLALAGKNLEAELQSIKPKRKTK